METRLLIAIFIRRPFLDAETKIYFSLFPRIEEKSRLLQILELEQEK